MKTKKQNTVPFWHSTSAEIKLIEKIYKRYRAFCKSVGIAGYRRRDVKMSLLFCHTGDYPLDLDKLLTAPRFDFMQDVAGIHNNINRAKLTMENRFIPHCAAEHKRGNKLTSPKRRFFTLEELLESEKQFYPKRHETKVKA